MYPRKDGKVRNVKVKTRTGEYQRPITKIAVIQAAEGYDKDESHALIRVECVLTNRNVS